MENLLSGVNRNYLPTSAGQVTSAMQGSGSYPGLTLDVRNAMNANAVRMAASAGGGLVAIYGFNLGVSGFFAAVAGGFGIYAALLVCTVVGVRTPDATPATSA